jgi:hypothetical protein
MNIFDITYDYHFLVSKFGLFFLDGVSSSLLIPEKGTHRFLRSIGVLLFTGLFLRLGVGFFFGGLGWNLK